MRWVAIFTDRAGALDIRHIEMDALYHGPGWTHRAEFADDVERATRAPAWICDAQYHWVVGDLLGERADTFVWLDLPRRTVMSRVLRRSVALYYYTASKAIYEEVPNRSTMYAARPHDDRAIRREASSLRMAQHLAGWVPPEVLRYSRAVMRRVRRLGRRQA